jgi:Abnormal spindle-like microcephaly-assoc'd, ASPM-SPD-2-Hydin
MTRIRLVLGALLGVLAVAAPSALAQSSTPFSAPDASFLSTAVGSTRTIGVVVSNADAIAHTFDATAASISGADASQFTITTDTCNATPMNPTDTCTVTVRFAPTSTGAKAAQLDLSYDSGTAEADVSALTGTATGTSTADTAPNPLGFGSVAVGVTSSTHTETLTNNGNLTLNIASIAVSAGATQFAITTQSCAATLAPAASCTVSLTFTPAAPGAQSGTLRFTDDATAGSTQDVALTGTGLGPTADPSKTTLSFGNQLVATTSAPQTVTFTNNGNQTLTISNLVASSGYAISTTTCGASLAAAASCAVSVTFTPTVTGSQPGTLTMTDNAFDSPQVVTLSGTGTSPNMHVSPTTIGFGSLIIGMTDPTVHTVTVQNTGTADLHLGAVSLSPQSLNPQSFKIDSGATCTNAVLAPAASCLVHLQFTPGKVGALSATLVIASTPTSGQVALTGTGTYPPPMLNVRAAVGCTKTLTTWTPRNDVPGFLKTVITRRSDRLPTGPFDGTALTPTSSGVLKDSGLTQYHTYYYAFYSQYQFTAGGEIVYSQATTRTLRTQRICTPMNNVITTTTPLVTWSAYTGALGYNLQFWHNGTKVRSPQMVANHYQVPTALSHTTTYTLKLYAYTKSNTNPGVYLGASSFTTN